MTTAMADHPELPADFVAWTAAAKAKHFAQLLASTTYPAVARPDLDMTKPWTMGSIALSAAKLARVFDNTSDVLDEGRPKIIHTQGAVAVIDFERHPDSPFSGVFDPSSSSPVPGLLRMSLAVPPTGKRAVTPGIGLKFFVDGHSSVDVVAMNHTVGQGRDLNVFSNTMTHDLRAEHQRLRPPQKIMSWAFERAIREPRHLTIDHFAAITADGQPVSEPRCPQRLVFRPHGDVRRVFRGRQYDDYRSVLADIEVGTSLYEVEAVGAGPGGAALTIGTITVAQPFCASSAGDRLFFRHHVDAARRLNS